MFYNNHGMLYNMLCHKTYVSVISYPWCYITYPNGYITGYITCYITSFATCTIQISIISTVIICWLTLLPAPLQRRRCPGRRVSLVRSLRLCSASATVTCRGWPLLYLHIQRLSSYSLIPLPLPALVLATAPSLVPNRWGMVGMLFPPTKHGIIGTLPSTFLALHK